MIELSKEEFDKLEKYKNKASLRINGDYLYKFVNATNPKFLEYVLSLPKIDGFLNPIDLISKPDGSIYGYSMPFLKEAKSLDELLNTIKKDDVLQIIKELFDTLTELNKYIVYGDIRMANILLYKDKPYFIDWEDGKMISSRKRIFITYYNPIYTIIIKHKLSILDLENTLTDNIKLYIVALSLIYGIDLEKAVIKNDTSFLYSSLKKVRADRILLEYFKYLLELADQNKNKVDEPFTDNINLIKLPSNKQKEKLARLIS